MSLTETGILYQKNFKLNVMEFMDFVREDYKWQKFKDKIVTNEEELKEVFIKLICNDFRYIEEVDGFVYVNNVKYKVRCDFFIVAKDHLIKEGFTEKPICVEVKYFGIMNNKKFASLISQTIDYSRATYSYNNKEFNPCMCLIFSNILLDVNFYYNRIIHAILARQNIGYINVKNDYYYLSMNLIKIIKIKNGKILKKPIDKKHYLTAQVGSATKIKKYEKVRNSKITNLSKR